ncbi:MAG: hypothetical protein AVDCRST_MAG48-147, partial [uncultured Friedmanniella sp.]
ADPHDTTRPPRPRTARRPPRPGRGDDRPRLPEGVPRQHRRHPAGLRRDGCPGARADRRPRAAARARRRAAGRPRPGHPPRRRPVRRHHGGRRAARPPAERLLRRRRRLGAGRPARGSLPRAAGQRSGPVLPRRSARGAAARPPGADGPGDLRRGGARAGL